MSVTRGVPDQEELNRLLAQTATGDRVAFADLYRRISPRLLGVCVRMLADRREAEEVLQETFVTVWQRASTFDPALAGATTWLVALARNKAIDRLRQHRGRASDPEFNLEAIADEDPTPAARVERGEEYRRLEKCMDELEPQQRGSIREAFFSGLTYAALAEGARVPLGTMKSWIRRGLMQLRACLEA
jgi:RNA polymerase sigma factor (sigma-70 family)